MLQGTFDFNNPVRHITAKAELLCDSSAPATKSGNPVVITDMAEQPHNIEVITTPGAEVKLQGKNYADVLSIGVVGERISNFLNNGDGSITVYSRGETAWGYPHTLKDLCPNMKVGETYTLTADTTCEAKYIWLLQYSNDWLFGTSKTITQEILDSEVLWYNGNSMNMPPATISNIQIEKGTVATEYEPYKKPQTATADSEGKCSFNSLYPTMLFTSSDNMNVNYQKALEGQNLTFTHDGDLVSIKVDRLGESKFFGLGVGQKANIKVIDTERTCFPTTSNYAVIYFNDVRTLPNMYVSEVHRDENTNEVSITLYDRLYDAAAHTVSELNLTSYTIGEFAAACAMLLGVRISLPALPEFELSYAEGANFEGTETLREALNDVAEATQTIYYINTNNELVFKRLDKDGVPAYTIDKSQYITLDSKTNRRLTSIVSATELGDNVEATTGLTGTTQYVRDNAFWDLHEDRTALVENALAALANFTINQFDCSWRGNYLLEPGDKLALIAKDDSEVHSFLLDDSITYNGAFKQRTQWIYEDEDEEHTNPTSLGDMLKQTFAKVDKANKQIELVVSEVDELSRITMDTGEIEAMVGRIETTTNDALSSINDELIEINNKVNASITAEEVEILVSEKVSSGVNSVETSTGFTFNETGLTVSKSESEISTTITEDGMTINKKGDEVLTANNQGVKAKDLHATTYLIIGNNSRFEDIGSTRTACYWIGG